MYYGATAVQIMFVSKAMWKLIYFIKYLISKVKLQNIDSFYFK